MHTNTNILVNAGQFLCHEILAFICPQQDMFRDYQKLIYVVSLSVISIMHHGNYIYNACVDISNYASWLGNLSALFPYYS